MTSIVHSEHLKDFVCVDEYINSVIVYISLVLTQMKDSEKVVKSASQKKY